MEVLIKEVCIVAPGSPLDGHVGDVLIAGGFIEKAAPSITPSDGVAVWHWPGACLSPGWVDIGPFTGDPGFEHRETFASAAAAAMAGGFTAIAPLPNTQPAVHSKTEVLYQLSKAQDELVDCYPLGALSDQAKGKDIAELLDMYHAGAIAFTDGTNPVQDAGLLLRALEYVSMFDGIIIQQPLDKTIGGGGQLHEGLVSTSLGLKGIPSIAEEMMVRRDLYLLEYAASRLHFANLSTAGAVAQVREAKARGLQVTASVAALNLAFDDTALTGFDTNLKVMPPLRGPEDIAALKAGLRDGTVDFIASNHMPWDEEGKKLEYPYAAFGASGLETVYPLLNEALGDNRLIVEKLSVQPRHIFRLPRSVVGEGAVANLTLFHPEREWVFGAKDNFSSSNNTPLLGRPLRGKVLAVINKGRHRVFA